MNSVAKLPRFRYTARDFESLLAAFEEIIRTNYEPYWNDFFQSNLGKALMDLLAFVGDGVHFYQDKRANNLYLDTVERRDIMQRIVKLLAYDPTGPIGSRLNALSYTYPDIHIDDAIVLSGHWGDDADAFMTFLGHTDKQTYYVGESITVNDKTFEVLTPKDQDDYGIVLTSNTSSTQSETVRVVKYGDYEEADFVDLLMYEGITTQDRYNAESDEAKKKFQMFETSLGEVIEDSWQICVNGVRPTDGTPGGTADTDGWVQATENTFVSHEAGAHVYVVDYVEDGKIRILFGDGETYGAVPPDGQPITIAYRRGGGFDTNILSDVLDPNTHTVSAWVDWLNPARTEGSVELKNNYEYVTGDNPGSYGGQAQYGADEEALDEIRIEAPQHYKSADKAITDADIIHIAKEFRLETATVTEQIMKASVQRPEGEMKYFDPSTGNMFESDLGGYVPIQYGGLPVSVYLPSYGANLIEVYIWSLGTENTPILPTTAMIDALTEHFNSGLSNEVGMTSVQYLVKEGWSAYVGVDIRKEVSPGVYKVVYDPAYDPAELASEAENAVRDLFRNKEPGENFKIFDVYKTVAAIDGILNFDVRLNSMTSDVEVDTKSVAKLFYLWGFTSGDFQPQV